MPLLAHLQPLPLLPPFPFPPPFSSQGDPADARMRDHASRRGIKLTSISRPIVPSDFNDFDIILAMDRKNLCGLPCYKSYLS